MSCIVLDADISTIICSELGEYLEELLLDEMRWIDEMNALKVEKKREKKATMHF